MNRFNRFIFLIGVLAVIGGVIPLRAEAALVELQFNDIEFSLPVSYDANGRIIADYTGDVFTFSSAAYPDSPASEVVLDPPQFGTFTQVYAETVTLYSVDTCWPTGLFTEACGGVRAETAYTVTHLNQTYKLSLDGNVDTAAATATLTPTPEEADVYFGSGLDSRVVMTGAMADAPDFIKNPLLAAANLAANQFGDGSIQIYSSITEFKPTLITADLTKTASEIQMDIYWSDLAAYYGSPSVTFGGTLSLDSVNTFFGWHSGKDAFFSRMANLASHAVGSCGKDVENCFQFSDVTSASFSYALPGVPPGTTVVPEPSTVVLLGFGLAGLAFARRRSRAC